MKKYSLVAMGGTFDIIHKGHMNLLSKAFELSSKVIIGLTGDELAEKKGKKLLNNYSTRFKNLNETIKHKFPHSEYQISKLDNDFGPAVLKEDVKALIVSEETSPQGKVLNDLRKKKNMSKIDVIVIPMTLAEDGLRISTTRIKNSEIDSEGQLP